MDKDLKRACKLLIKECTKAIEMMAENKEATHSFNVVSGGKSTTFLILFTPSHLDYKIYDALKPVIELELGEGTLVEPNPHVPRG